MRCVVSGMRNAVRCEIWCYGDMVIWPALQARAFTLVIIFNCAMVRSLFVVVVVVVRHTQKILPIVHAAAGARACRRRRSSYPKNPPNCARCYWRARVPVKWHLPDLRFRFLAREIDLKSWNHVF